MAKSNLKIVKSDILHKRRLPVGAEVVPGGVNFRVWAPQSSRVEIIFEEKDDGSTQLPPEPMNRDKEGFFSATINNAGIGTRYKFRLDNSGDYPDPVSRYQPDGPFGFSQVVDPGLFIWTDKKWHGIEPRGNVIYEMHIGTFTKDGTWISAIDELEELKRIGITILEIMPVADFSGRFGWGYDGVNLFAPCRLYGEPDHFRNFVDKAHSLGIGVILDVVYNHVGPNGNFLPKFTDWYFSKTHTTDWGPSFNFDNKNSGPVRDFILANIKHWIDEYHMDGFRFDATQNIYDDSADHILAACSRYARECAGKRSIYLIAENEPQDVKFLRSIDKDGYGFDGLWNDDFHHSAMVRLTGRREAYYTDYTGIPQEYISMAKYGFLYQGQRYKWQKKRRGTPTSGISRHRFVNFIQNHDQIANSGRGLRVHFLTSPGLYRAMTAVMILCPETPMLFQGQEFAASTPFFYFANHPEDIAKKIYDGRNDFLSQFRSLASPEMRPNLPDPGDPSTFIQSKLDFSERELHSEIYLFYCDLLQLRHQDPVFRMNSPEIDGAVLGNDSFLLRYFGKDGDDRLIVVNFGADIQLDPAPEPLLAPPPDMCWENLFSSENPKYGGTGTAPLDTEENWIIPGQTAVVLKPQSIKEEKHG